MGNEHKKVRPNQNGVISGEEFMALTKKGELAGIEEMLEKEPTLLHKIQFSPDTDIVRFALEQSNECVEGCCP